MNSNHFKVLSLLLTTSTIVLGTACKSTTDLPGTGTTTVVAATPTSTPTPTPTPAAVTGTSTAGEASVDAEIYLKIERMPEDNTKGTPIPVGTCKVAFGAGGTPGNPTIQPCTATYGSDFSVPEGDMYFSNFYFTAGSNYPNRCAYVIFRPYYYMGSVTALNADGTGGFFTPWLNTIPTSGIDCSPAKATAGCYNGPAVSLVPGFPGNSGLVILTDTTHELTSTVTSAHKNNQNSNRFLSNNESNWANSESDASFTYPNYYVGDTAAAGAGYMAASASTPLGYTAAHQDYVVECRDRYFDVLSEVKVILNDENTSTGPGATRDDFHTWP